MKNKTTVRTLLGLTQEDMARVLNVSRGQWSMYESGKRNLPQSATLLLAEMLTHVQSAKSAANLRRVEQAENECRCYLEKLLQENTYQRGLTARKIAALERKRDSSNCMAELNGFLTGRTADKSKKNHLQHHPLMVKIAKTSAINYDLALLKLGIRQELFELEKLLLESKIRKLSQSPENKSEKPNQFINN